MAIFDITHLHALTQMKELFPELTEKQFQFSLCWVWGIGVQEIAAMNGCSPEAVKKLLQRCRERFGVSTLEAMRNIMSLRLFTALWGMTARITK
ncbi:hypothetical protein U0D24_21655 [Hafnia paralvei]|jgi:hypothetical protein|uniref:hypothetical protein n=1 Tax=Hafnia paralvei TaxID=546367 RepID=UPI002FDBAAC7